MNEGRYRLMQTLYLVGAGVLVVGSVVIWAFVKALDHLVEFMPDEWES